MSDTEIVPGCGDKHTDARASSTPDALSRVLERLRNDRYSTAEGEGRDDVDRWHRRSWNAAMDHAISIVSQGSVEAGLRELRDAPKVVLPRHWLAEHEAGHGPGGCSCRAGVVSCAMHGEGG